MWVAWLRFEFRTLAVGLPVVVAMLSVVVLLELSLSWLAWVGVPPAAWLGWRAWPLAADVR